MDLISDKSHLLQTYFQHDIIEGKTQNFYYKISNKTSMTHTTSATLTKVIRQENSNNSNHKNKNSNKKTRTGKE